MSERCKKRHEVQFVATICGSVIVEGDECPADAEEYVGRHLEFSGEVETVDVDISHTLITVDNCYEIEGTEEVQEGVGEV